MPKVTDPTKQLTDVVAIKQLQRQSKDPDVWEFVQDYAIPSVINGKREKGKSPYAKFYLNTDNPSERMAVISGLPMVDADGVKCEPQWIQAGTTYHQKNNVFSALVNDIPGRITLICKNDQPEGVRKKNDRVVFSPQLFVSGVEVPRPSVTLLPVDPRNPNYLENTLEWDYGVCQRHLRAVEGRIHGYWIFPANPGGEVRIVYNQTGQYRLRLGKYAIDADTEVIPASVFASASYPFEVSDSATYNPDANPETTSVDGIVRRQQGSQAWSIIHDATGLTAEDTPTGGPLIGIWASAGDSWADLVRCISVFDTSPLPDGADISAATLSFYGWNKGQTAAWNVNVNLYAATTASNTALATGDYLFTGFGSTAYSTAITYDGFSTTGYNDFALNAAGIAAISKTGVSKFGALNANYDVLNTPPTSTDSEYSVLQSYKAEQGEGFKPKLVVTYTDTWPTVTTQAVTAITGITATGNGNITAIGGSAVTQHGHCWNTTGTPTTADSKTTKGNGLVGAFTSSITGLTPGTLYYVRAYATNTGATSYGSEVTFTALSTPTVTTQAVIDIVTTTATGRGNITNIGTSSVTEHGHCWNTTGTPTTADSKTTNGAGSAGAFTSAMTVLVEETKYYVRAYATNTSGTSYGAEVVFWAGLGTVYPVDPLTRVSGIRWVFDAFPGKVPHYYMEISLGGVTTSYVPAVGDPEPVPAIPLLTIRREWVGFRPI